MSEFIRLSVGRMPSFTKIKEWQQKNHHDSSCSSRTNPLFSSKGTFTRTIESGTRTTPVITSSGSSGSSSSNRSSLLFDDERSFSSDSSAPTSPMLEQTKPLHIRRKARKVNDIVVPARVSSVAIAEDDASIYTPTLSEVHLAIERCFGVSSFESDSADQPNSPRSSSPSNDDDTDVFVDALDAVHSEEPVAAPIATRRRPGRRPVPVYDEIEYGEEGLAPFLRARVPAPPASIYAESINSELAEVWPLAQHRMHTLPVELPPLSPCSMPPSMSLTDIKVVGTSPIQAYSRKLSGLKSERSAALGWWTRGQR